MVMALAGKTQVNFFPILWYNVKWSLCNRQPQLEINSSAFNSEEKIFWHRLNLCTIWTFVIVYPLAISVSLSKRLLLVLHRSCVHTCLSQSCLPSPSVVHTQQIHVSQLFMYSRSLRLETNFVAHHKPISINSAQATTAKL